MESRLNRCSHESPGLLPDRYTLRFREQARRLLGCPEGVNARQDLHRAAVDDDRPVLAVLLEALLERGADPRLLGVLIQTTQGARISLKSRIARGEESAPTGATSLSLRRAKREYYSALTLTKALA